MSISKTDDPDPVNEGDELTFTLTVENDDRRDARDVQVVDRLPNGVDFVDADASCDEQRGRLVVCDLGTVQGGDSEAVDIVVEATRTGTLTNRAAVFSEGLLIDEVTERTEVDEEEDNDSDNDGANDDDDVDDDNDGVADDDDVDDDNDGSEDDDDDNESTLSASQESGDDDDDDDDVEQTVSISSDDDDTATDDQYDDGEGTTGDGEGTTGDDDNDGVSADANEDGSQARAGGVTANAGGDPDNQAPVNRGQAGGGNIVDEVDTNGPLPETGGESLATGVTMAMVLFGGGLLALRLAMGRRRGES